MKLHADLRLPVAVRGADVEPVPSPVAGVERRMLERDGDEVARCTTLVTFAPGSAFPQHTHGGGEEFLVLTGDFCDRLTGTCQAATYVRHPIGSSHEPWSVAGGTILVKLRQMTDSQEQERTVVDAASWRREHPGYGKQGWARLPLFSSGATGERVAMEWWAPGTRREFCADVLSGIELFVLTGFLQFRGSEYGPWSWFRIPPAASWEMEGRERTAPAKFTSGLAAAETQVWLKTGHLGRDAVLVPEA